MNYILSRHGYPMIVVRSRQKQDYLEALHKSDLKVGNEPSVGAKAALKQIKPFQKHMTDLMAHEIEMDTLFVTEKSDDVWWYDGQRIQFRTPTYGNILRELQTDYRPSFASLQKATGVNRSALQKMIQTMTEKGYIERDDEGGWRVFITPSV